MRRSPSFISELFATKNSAKATSKCGKTQKYRTRLASATGGAHGSHIDLGRCCRHAGAQHRHRCWHRGGDAMRLKWLAALAVAALLASNEQAQQGCAHVQLR